MEFKELKASVEAILFAGGEPVNIDRIAQVLEIDEETAEKLCQSLGDEYDERGSAIRVVRIANSFQLATRKEYGETVRRAFEIKRNTPLSQAAFEVLAVIAYNQPVTKAFIEQVRGVNCDGVVNSLVSKGLVEERGRLELPGRPLLYGTTSEFLRCFGLTSIDRLPPVEEKKDETEITFESLAAEDKETGEET